MNTNLPITISQYTLLAFCQQYYITKLSLFGSVLREDFTDKSDVDFLVEFQTGKTPSAATRKSKGKRQRFYMSYPNNIIILRDSPNALKTSYFN